MAILDNIQALPSYGERYKLEYTNRVGNSVSLKIFQRDYVGTVTDLTGTGVDVSISKSFIDQDVFRPFAGTRIEISMFASTTVQYEDFSVCDNRKYYVTVVEATKTLAFGYIMPETYQQDWGSLPDKVVVAAMDGIGTLKEYDFVNNDGSDIDTIERLSDIVSFLLYKAGNKYQWYDAIEMEPDDAMDPGYGALYNCYVDTTRFIGRNCYEVFQELLESFNAQLSQNGLAYLISVPTRQGITKAVIIANNGTYGASGVSLSDTYETTVDGKFAGRGVMQAERPLRSVEIVYLREAVVNEPHSWAFEGDSLEINEDGVIKISHNYLKTLSGQFIRHSIPMDRGYFQLSWEAKYTFEGVPLSQYPFNTFGVRVSDEAFTYNPDDYFFTIENFNQWVAFDRILLRNTSGSDVQFILQPLTEFTGIDNRFLHIRNVSIKPLRNNKSDNYKEEYIIDINISNNNQETLSVEKMYHYPHRTGLPWNQTWNRNDYYIASNQFLKEYTSGIKNAFLIWKDLVNDNTGTLNGRIRRLYREFYSFTKLRYSGGLWNFGHKFLQAYSIFTDSHIKQLMKISSFTYYPQAANYEIDAIGIAEKEVVWILADNIWNDQGIWIDTETWND